MARLTALVVEATMLVEEMSLDELAALENAVRARVDELVPLCGGTCGQPTESPTGMCYQCQCEAHAQGWYDMDTGYVRV